MKSHPLALWVRACAISLAILPMLAAHAAPGEDVIVLSGPITYSSLPLPEAAPSEQMYRSNDIPSWMRARISRFTAKAFSATADDGSITTDSDVVTTTTSQGLRKACVQEVGTTTASGSLGGRYGPGQKDQVVVLRGDLVNICR